MQEFEVEKSLTIDELKCKFTQLRHKSGARILHLGNDDPENVFCLGFRTLPTRSDGAPHILEHTVLCGSERYPVRDPFFSMIRRSLNTFMNAMTGDDMTFYPAASQVKKDFYNLLDVYIDAVFHPCLKELSFKQEGHRLEFEQPMDPKSPLQFKGIVFNEMKGAMASPDARAWHKLSRVLLPDTPYHFNSGGDPAVIPELTYEELKAFHKEYYAPSRCLFFFYGDLPLEEHLKVLSEGILKNAPCEEELPPIPRQPRWTKPRRIEDTYPESGEDKAITLFSWLTCTPLDQLEALALSVLDTALMGSDAAPLKIALLRSGLCKEAYGFIDLETADIPFILMLKGCKAEDSDALEKLVFETLQKIAQEGLADDLLEAAIHQLEFGRTEILGDSAPFGLTLFRRTAPLLLHGGEGEEGLYIHSLFNQLREQFDAASLINKYLLDNQHFCRLTMRPDPKRADEEIEAEKAKLAAIEEKLTDEDRARIVKESEELVAFQAEEDDVDVLPKVTIDDVPKEARDFPLTQKENILHHSCFTNGIVDAMLVFDLPFIATEDLACARMLASFLPEVGCGGRSWEETTRYMQLYTADVGVGIGLHPQGTDYNQLRPAITVEGKALERNMDKLFPLFGEIISSADFTNLQRLEELVMQHLSSLENSLVNSALRYAVNLAASSRSPGGYISNQLGGIDYLHAVRKAAQDIPALSRKLQEMTAILGGPYDLVLSCDDKLRDAIESNDLYGLEVPTKQHEPFVAPTSYPPVHSQGRIIASPVAFTVRMLNTVPYTHPDTPALSVAASLFNHKTLHREIREIGGAYGGGSRANPSSGTFYFYGYRDPHLESSLRAMEKALAVPFDGRELEEAKLNIIQKLDSPVSPGSRAGVEYARLRGGRDLAMRQAYRDRLLLLSAQDIHAAIETHLVPAMNDSTIVSFASQEFFDRENTRDLEILPV